MNDILMECANLAKEFEGLHDLRDDGLVYAYHDPVDTILQYVVMAICFGLVIPIAFIYSVERIIKWI